MDPIKRIVLVAVLCAAVLAGCAKPSPLDTPVVYPAPPDDPKIVYLKSYRGSLDFRKPSFLDALFGAPQGSDFLKPYGVHARDGRIYVTSSTQAAVFVLDTKARRMDVLAGTGATRLARPIGVATGSDGTVYVTDALQGRIFAFSAAGDVKTTIGKKGEMKNPAGIAVNNELKRLYVADSFGHTVHVYSFAGERLFQFGTQGHEPGEFYFPTNLAIDRRNGTVYVVDTQNFRVQAFDAEGRYLRSFGQLGDRFGTFSRPKGIGVDSEGHVYVADAAFDNFQIFDETGRLMLFVGSAGREPGQFSLPAGLYVDEQDRIYVVDSLNNRVQMFQYLSERWQRENPDEFRKYVSLQQGGK